MSWKVIHKNSNISFNVSGDFNVWWFKPNKINTWEQNTFHILDYYSKDQLKSTYIDIGAWIGPTVLYAANLYKRVIAIEPDPVALSRLEQNLSVNSFSNITLIKKALSNKIGKISFGGNGPLGNSESTMLVSDPRYSEEHWGDRHSKEERKQNIIEVDTTTIEQIIEDTNVDIKDIALIKLDIEGGEFIVTPCLRDFLKKYKIPFYISLHYCFLKLEHIEYILDILFEIYEKCYFIEYNGTKTEVTKEYILQNKIKELVYE